RRARSPARPHPVLPLPPEIYLAALAPGRTLVGGIQNAAGRSSCRRCSGIHRCVARRGLAGCTAASDSWPCRWFSGLFVPPRRRRSCPLLRGTGRGCTCG
ncbi:unnamed protein product, partial [Ectocarpus sp. 8 AP-2014]